MLKRKQFIVVGAGGFGQEIVWAAKNLNSRYPQYDILGYCDDDLKKAGGAIYGYPVLGTPEGIDGTLEERPSFVCAIGKNAARSRVVDRLLRMGWLPVTIIDPSVIVAEGVVVGLGSYVGAGTILSPYAVIGDHVMINHACSVGHNSEIGNFSQLSPGSRISGGVKIGTHANIGSNAVVAPGKKIGSFSTLGACSFAMTDISDNCTAVGVPARVIL
jgi:sugar O-acyltransferase (sialic acid O-acetyltransferase NeuD family)